MKKLRLSDYAVEAMAKARREREAIHNAAVREHEKIASQVWTERDESYNGFMKAANEGRIFSAVGNLCTWGFKWATPIAPEPEEPGDGIEERRFEAGIVGEQVVLDHVEAQLDAAVLSVYVEEDRCDHEFPGNTSVAISGYKNYKGEIDLLLMTPWGLAALEVKNVQGMVYNHGTNWFRDKYDRAGFIHEQAIPIADRGGRGPARQLSEPVEVLQRFLESRGVSVPIRRAIVLAHPQSFVGAIEFGFEPLEMVSHVGQLDVIAFCDIANNPRKPCYNDHEINTIADLIEQDHQFHASRQSRRVH